MVGTQYRLPAIKMSGIMDDRHENDQIATSLVLLAMTREGSEQGRGKVASNDVEGFHVMR